MDISLLHAGLAAGAALAAVPIILHLFMKQTPKHVIFPALRLIKERHKRSRQKLRIKNWLLLLARMLLVALMALALARPALNSEANLGDREVPTAMALVFDTSLSMEYTERNATRLAEAKTRADEILKKTPEASQVFVIDSAEPGAPVALSPSAARKRIGALALRPANRPLNAALGQAYRAVTESDKVRREVYVLTDLARSSWDMGRPVEGLDALKKVRFGVATYVLRLTPKEVKDVAIIEAQPTANVATEGEPVEIKTRLRASAPAGDRVVELYVDRNANGQPIPRDKKTVQFAAKSEQDVVFKTPPNLSVGLHQGEVHLSGTDPLAFDDRRYFSFLVQPAYKVLVISDRKSDADFVVEALDPSRWRNTSTRPFHIDLAKPARLKEAIKDYSCVFLLNVAELEDAAWNNLNGYVRGGGGLVIGLGDRVVPGNYNSQLAAQVVPATLDKKPFKASPPTSFGKADVTHTLFHQYPRELGADLSGVPVYQYLKVEPAKDSRTILAFLDAAPALVERAFQGPKMGRVLLWATPLARKPNPRDPGAWNEFPASEFWSFVYLMYQTVPYLAGAAGERLNYEAGNDVVLSIDPSKRYTNYAVQGPDKKTTDRLSPLVSTPSLVIQAPQVLGQWTVTATGGGLQPQTLGFSINPPVNETEVVALEPRDLDALFGAKKYHLADDPESLKQVVQVGRVGRELFPLIMLLILALVTAENFLANRFYREKAAKA